MWLVVLFVVCCVLVIVRGSSLVARWLSFVACVLFVVCCLLLVASRVGCVLFVVCWFELGVRCLVFGVWRCLDIIVCCSLFCCVVFVVCCLGIVFALSFCGLLCVGFEVVGCCG